MILRRSVILALGSMPLLARGVFSQTAVKARRVGLLSSGAPFTDTSEIFVGLTAGFSKRGYVVRVLCFSSGEQLKHTRTDCRDSLTN
jgi:hypothetical protein